MASRFSKVVMISLQEHKAQTLLEGISSTIRRNEYDLDIQIKALDILVNNLEGLYVRVEQYLEKVKEDKENTFCYEDLDLDDEIDYMQDVEIGQAKVETLKYMSKNPTLHLSAPKKNKGLRSSRLKPLTPLFEEDLNTRRSFETIVSNYSYTHNSNHSNASMETISISGSPPATKTSSDSKDGSFRSIDPKKIPKRKPVPTAPLTPKYKPIKRKEVPKRPSSLQETQKGTSDKHNNMNLPNTPPATDDENNAPVPSARNSLNGRKSQRRAKGSKLRIAIPNRRLSVSRPMRTPSTTSLGSARVQKRAMEELERAIAAFGKVTEENERDGIKSADLQPRQVGKTRSRKRTSNVRKTYSAGIPRVDSPVLGNFDVVFATPSPRPMAKSATFERKSYRL